MSFSNTPKIPAEMQGRIKSKIALISFRRLRIVLPVLVVFQVFLVIMDLYSGLWSGDHHGYFIIDASFSAVFAVMTLLLFLKMPRRIEDVSAFHPVFKNLAAALIITWGALVTAVDFPVSGDYVTFVICMLLCGGLLLVNKATLIVFSLGGLAFLHLPALMPFQAVFVIMTALVISVVINELNRASLTESIVLEQELEKKVAERTIEFEKAADEAIRADRLKTLFLANMSHEIRTPLNGILGFADLLNADGLNRETRHAYLDVIKTSGNTLLEILSGVLDVARIEAGETELAIESFDLREIVAEAIREFSGRKKVVSGAVRLIPEVDDDAGDSGRPLMINSDRLRVIQILNNLISNALKYTQKGEVGVSCGSAEDGKAEIRVRDTGRGIKAEELEYIFERFHQSSQDPYGKREGVGLGLTIVKAYSEMLGGSVEVESEPGKGSIFRIFIKTDLVSSA